ncbi:MAG: nucleotidyltransferase domain-containing protein [Clostridium sp.]
MYGINEKVYSNLIRYFKNSNEINKVIIFGSRAKGTAKTNSDIDFCIECLENYKGTIASEIDDIIGIYSCDIVFIGSLNNEIENQINRDGIVIYEKEVV